MEKENRNDRKIFRNDQKIRGDKRKLQMKEI